jgi:hypothetical protein
MRSILACYPSSRRRAVRYTELSPTQFKTFGDRHVKAVTTKIMTTLEYKGIRIDVSSVGKGCCGNTIARPRLAK